jgi:multidrug efflux pump subunit AcrA (membrane-fusion protein)
MRPAMASSRSCRPRGAFTTTSVASLLALALATSGGIWWFVKSRQPADLSAGILLHKVERDDFELTVTERGEIEAFDVTEVRSLVKSNNTTGNAILRIVTEGTEVKKGDFLVELDSSALKTQRTSQKILVNAAKAAEVEAKNTYDTAVIAKREYLDGTNVQERQVIESEIFVAEENLNRAKEYYAYSQKLASKGYVNELQLEADRFAVEKANKDLDAAKTKLRVLDDYTKPKMLSTLESAILIAKAKWDSAQNSHQLELEKLKEFDDQIAKCTIVAPQDGVVKYAHVMDGRGDQEFIVEEGAVVRERQVIITLPNADSMRVNLSVNESLIQYVLPGLAASISPVGFGEKVLHGVVEKVNQYAEPTGWRQANVKEYKALVSIDDPTRDLRAGMTAAVTIRCAELPNVLQVPVQAIYAHGSKFYCFVYNQGSWEAREIKPGPTNDKFFVVHSGLNEGDAVAMNPREYVDQVDLPKLSPEEAQRAVPQRNGRGRGPGGPGGANTSRDPTGRRPGEISPEQPSQTPADEDQHDRNAPGETRAPAGSGAEGQLQTASTSSTSSQGTAQ